jgi:hypothetical protein
MQLKLKLFSFLLLVIPACISAQDNNNRELSPNRRHNGQPLASLIRGPYLQSATSTSVHVRWRTDTWARSRVRYGTSADSLNMFADDSALVTEHEVKLTGLMPATRYYYSIGGMKDTLQGDRENYFMTLPAPGSTGLYRIGVFGDCGNNSVNQRSVRDQVVKYLGNNYMHSWILLGDNAYRDGEDAQYQTNFFNIYRNNLLKKYPLFPSPGNHDYHDVEFSNAVAQQTHEVAYFRNFTMPVNGEAGGVPSHNQAYYSFDVGNIHFLSLDSYGKEENSYRLYDTAGPQVQWIKKDLEANKNKGWVVAFWHHPPYTMGSHNSDRENELIRIRGNFIGILERYGVDLILCGHSHLYERSKLMKGHFGLEASFDSLNNNLSQSSALYNGARNSCPYIKSDANNQGTVYVVSGSAGQLGPKQTTYPHSAFFYSNNTIGGAAMLEVNENRLDLKWICADGEIRDSFTMMKNVNKKQTIRIRRGETAVLTASYVGNYKWSAGNQATRSISVSPTSRRSKYIVKDEHSCVQDEFEVIVSR